MAPARRPWHSRHLPVAGLVLFAAAALVTVGAVRSCAPAGGVAHRRGAPGLGGDGTDGAVARIPALPTLPPAPASTGWEEAAGALVDEAAALLVGSPGGGAFAEALAEASRQDLARYPPERATLHRMLLGSERERALALAALATRPIADAELVRLVLRSYRPEDAPLTRLLGAEVLAAVSPPLLSLHEEELLRAFAREENPLVLAVALPALERMRPDRLRSLLEAQLEAAAPAMLPVLVGLARDRLGPAALAEVGILVTER